MKGWDSEKLSSEEETLSLDMKLVRAASSGDASAVKAHIKAGAYVDCFEGLPLRLAAWNGHVEALEELVGAKADIHVRDDEALRGAAAAGKPETVRVLLAHGAGNRRAAVLAAQNGHRETLAVIEESLGMPRTHPRAPHMKLVPGSD